LSNVTALLGRRIDVSGVVIGTQILVDGFSAAVGGERHSSQQRRARSDLNSCHTNDRARGRSRISATTHPLAERATRRACAGMGTVGFRRRQPHFRCASGRDRWQARLVRVLVYGRSGAPIRPSAEILDATINLSTAAAEQRVAAPVGRIWAHPKLRLRHQKASGDVDEFGCRCVQLISRSPPGTKTASIEIAQARGLTQ
jgi:hypothetical protein